MRSFSKLAVAAAAVSAVQAADPSLCDKYTTALLKDNTGENQLKLLTLVVNTAVIGNYTQPNKNAVPGILNPNATYNGQAVNLVPYFNGDLLSSNRGGSSGVSVNFLNGGGAAPLMKNMAADTSAANSNQAVLLNHLYQYFGALLGCTASGFPQYAGHTSMYEVHKYMALSNAEVQYFIQQVGLSATSFGVTADDAKAVGDSLNKAFGYKCEPAAEVVTGGKQLQSICTDDTCPSAPMADCGGYSPVVKPKKASASGSASPSGSAASSGSTGAAMPSGSAPSPSGSAPAPASTTKATSGAGMLSVGYGAAFIGAAAVLAL